LLGDRDHADEATEVSNLDKEIESKLFQLYHKTRKTITNDRQLNNSFKFQEFNPDIFESGWEFGYWLSNLITERLSWNPLDRRRRKQISERRKTANYRFIRNRRSL